MKMGDGDRSPYFGGGSYKARTSEMAKVLRLVVITIGRYLDTKVTS